EIAGELEAEGHLDPNLALLKRQIDIAARQKRIRQLLESARSRLQGEEYPLALQKVQEILTLDPDNAEAIILKSRIEGVRSEKQIDGWLRLARQHIENNAFGHAREALHNVLQLRPQDARATAVAAEIDRREQEYVHIRKEKEQLYQAAVEAYQRGDFSSAMTKLERVLEMDRRAPDSAHRDQGNAYRNFYNQVRSEYDAIQSAYAEARQLLEDQNCAAALAICNRHLVKYPDHALFQGLKFDVQEQQRLQLSAYIAEIDRRVEAETDLERKVNIIRDAVARFPDEAHFAGLLRIMTERLDLVTGIIAKARYYEERLQFAEALTQWEILRSIHSRHPGLQFEIERLGKRLAQQVWADGKARHVRQIDARLEAGEYERAIELAQGGLEEYPDDSELLALQQLATEARNRAVEARTLLEEGERLFESGHFDDALTVLHKAQEMDARCGRACPQLLDKLVARAQLLIDSDPPAAERCVESAFALDPSHAGARDMHRLLQDGGSRSAVAVETGPDRVSLHPETREFQPVMDTVLLGEAHGTEIFPVGGDATVAPTPEPPPAVVSKPRRTIVIRWAAPGALALVVVAAVVVLMLRPRPAPQPPALVAFQIHITPAGASVYLGDKIIGTSDSRMALPPGAYNFQVAKEGYQSKVIPVELRAGRSAQRTGVTLDPLPQKLKISTDLKAGKVSLDGAAAVDLDINGELVIDVAAPGKHTLQIESGTEKAAVSFETSPLALPVIAKPEASAGLDVVLVSAYRDRASIQTTLGAVPARIDDRDAGSLTPNGLELNELAPASHDLTLGTGARAWNGDIAPGREPSLSVFVRSGVRLGTILVEVEGPNGSQVTLDNIVKGATKDGILRMFAEPGTHSIRAAHEGYLEARKDGVVVRKGQFVRVPILLMRRVDVVPEPIGGRLATATGKLMLDISPSSAKVKYQRIGEDAWHEAAASGLVLEIGHYLIAASAPGYADQNADVTVDAGATKTTSLNLQKAVPKPPPPESIMDAKNWSQPWSQASGWFARTGGDFVLYNPTPAIGIFRFTAQPNKSFRGAGKIRWVLNYLDERNYILFELDKNYNRSVFRDGKRTGRGEKTKVDAAAAYYNLELSVTPKRIVVKLLLGDKSSAILDEWEPTDADLSKGHFGFYLPGETQMLLANFSFTGQ
ncbi:MAG: PEGA domain-containing protein, partial [Bryobacteraceae bacterium]